MNMENKDITGQEKAQQKCEQEVLDLNSVINKVADGITLSDKKGLFELFNERMQEITGYTIEEANSQQDFTSLLYPDLKERQLALERLNELMAKKPYEEIETTIQAKNGAKKTLLVSTSLIEYKKRGMFLSIYHDITERKWFENELRQLVIKDSQTGLFNHRYLKEALDAASSRAKRQFSPLSVIMMDIDYFKSINDVYSHIFGDLVLKQFAEQLKKTVRAYDVVIRYGGEEFIIISSDTDRENALILAKRILDKINLYNFGDKKHVVKLKLSLAVASYPEDAAECGMDLVKCVDQILGKVKEGGGNRVFSYLDLKKEGKIITEKPSVHNLKLKIDKLTRRANQGLIEAILAFAKTIEMKDHYTGEHVEKTVHYATRMAEELNFPKDKIELIKQAAMLHDLGKVGISENILLKKSKLTKKEFEEIKKHPQIGIDIIRPIQALHPIIPFMLHHHERWDGTGYPYGLKRERIPLGARIIAIADVYQALVSHRPYRKAYSKREAMKMIKEGAGTHFDPDIVQVFLKILEEEK